MKNKIISIINYIKFRFLINSIFRIYISMIFTMFGLTILNTALLMKIGIIFTFYNNVDLFVLSVIVLLLCISGNKIINL
jgi:hypothetical protein